MKVLLVGGFGYIGQSLALELISRGHEVTLVGRDSRRAALTNKEFLHWDATKEWIGEPPSAHVIVHLASANSEVSIDSLETYLNNIAVTRNVLRLCEQIPECSLLYVSTFQVFGRWSGLIHYNSPAVPGSDYGFSHWVAEEHVKMFARRNRRRAVVVRLTNVVGAGADPVAIRWDTVPAQFCRQAVETKTIKIRSSGLQQRDFVTVTSVAQQLSVLIEKEADWLGESLLISSGWSCSILRLALLVSEQAQHILGHGVSVVTNKDDDHSKEDLALTVKSSLPEQSLHGLQMDESQMRCVIDELLMAMLHLHHERK